MVDGAVSREKWYLVTCFLRLSAFLYSCIQIQQVNGPASWPCKLRSCVRRWSLRVKVFWHNVQRYSEVTREAFGRQSWLMMFFLRMLTPLLLLWMLRLCLKTCKLFPISEFSDLGEVKPPCLLGNLASSSSSSKWLPAKPIQYVDKSTHILRAI